jgi:hypothetical protein
MPARDNYAGQSRFKRLKRRVVGKAMNTQFKMTSARKAALKKAQDASARARKAAAGAAGSAASAAKSRFNKAGGNTATLRAKLKAQRVAKTAKAAGRSVKAIAKNRASQAKSAASKRFAKAGGNTKALRAKMKVQNAAKTVRAASRSAVAVAKNRAGVSTKKQATKRLNSNQVEKVLKGSGNKAPSINPKRTKSKRSGSRKGARGAANARSRRMRSPILERGRKAFNRWNFNKRKKR